MNRLRPGYMIGATVMATASVTLAIQLATSFKTPPPRPTVLVAASAPTTVNADISGFAFPAVVKVAEGGAVTWTNRDSARHTVTFDDVSIGKREVAGGASQQLTFAKKGTYTYHCEIHGSMTGTVEVVGATSVAPNDPYGDPYATDPYDPYGASK